LWHRCNGGLNHYSNGRTVTVGNLVSGDSEDIRMLIKIGDIKLISFKLATASVKVLLMSAIVPSQIQRNLKVVEKLKAVVLGSSLIGLAY
jgi:hypothetical protein